MPDINSSKTLMQDWVLYASSMGKINRLEKLQVIGTGKIIIHQLQKYVLKKQKYTEILIEEKDFNTKYKVSLQCDIIFQIYIVSHIGHDKGTKLKQMFLGFQGGSNSTVLISMLVYQLEILIKNVLMSTLTLWEILNIMKPDYILPLLNIGTKGKTKQVLDILTKINSGVYGYSLNIKMDGNSFHSLINKSLVANLKIKTSFCISKCSVEDRYIYNLENCHAK